MSYVLNQISNSPKQRKSHLELFLGLLFGERIVRLASLHVAAFLDQMTDFVGRNRELALGADIQGGSDQKIVAPPLAFR